jgi:hypothetical protein
MSAAAAGKAPEAKKVGGEAEAGHAGAGGAKESWFSRGVEGAASGSWKLITGVTGFFWRRIMGIGKGAWEATGGQFTGEMAEVGKRLGYESKEQGLFNNIAGVIEATSGKVAKVLGGTVDYVAGLPGRVAGRPLRGVQYAWNALFGIKSEGGKAAEAQGDMGTAAPAHA